MNQLLIELMKAVCTGDLEKARNLINRFRRLFSMPLENGYDFLLHSTELKHTEITKLLLNNSVKVNKECNKYAHTPLHFAVENGDFEIVEMLLGRYANINAKNESGSTPLLCAVLNGNEKIAELLLSRKADLCGNNDGITPLQVAIEKGLSNLIGKLSNVETETVSISGLNKLNTEMEKPPLKRKSELELVSLTSKKKQIPTLFAAVENGDLELVKMFLEQGADINEKNTHGSTPIFDAIRKGHVEITEFLLNKGATNSGNKNGITPLHVAAGKGLTTIVKMFLEAGADINEENGNGSTPIFYAVSNNHVEVTKFLLNEGAYTEVNHRGIAPLHIAVQRGFTNIVKLFIEEGADINEENSKGSTPIFYAVSNGHVEITELLLNKGAKTRGNINGITPLHIAAETGLTDFVATLLKHGADINEACSPASEKEGFTPLHFAVESNEEEIVIMLLNHGANVHAAGDFSKCEDYIAYFRSSEQPVIEGDITPLHIAAEKGLTNIIEHILKLGADVNSTTKDGLTALHFAAANHNKEATELLLNFGANVNAKGHCLITPRSISSNINIKKYNGVVGITPLHIAARKGLSNIAEQLLKHGADINAVSKDGFTPVHFAIAKNKQDTALVLLNHSANTDAKACSLPNARHIESEDESVYIKVRREDRCTDEPEFDRMPNTIKEEFSPLQLAARYNDVDIINLLLNNNARIDSCDNNYKTPLYIALQCGNIEAAKFLIDHGVNIDAVDQNGRTMLNSAITKGYSLLTENILKHFRPDKNNERNKASLNIALKACGGCDTKNKKNKNIKKYKKIVQCLVEYGFTMRPEDVNDRILVYKVIEMGYLELIDDLLKNGLDLKRKIKDSLPLHIAVKHQQIEVVKLMLTRGADVNATDHAGKTPIVYSTENSDLNMTNLLLLNGATIEDDIYYLLTLAIQRGFIKMVEIILEYAIDINAPDENGVTSLHETAIYGMDYEPDINARVEIAKLLLENGASVNAKSKIEGVTTLHLACKNKFKNLVEILLEYKADVDCLIEGEAFNSAGYSYFGQTAMHIEAKGGDVDIIRILLQGGANINYHDRGGDTPLHVATEHRNIDVVSELVKRGAFINARDNYGRTPLHIACEGKEDIINILVRGGADINCRSNKGSTPLHVAATRKNFKALSALLKHGAFVDAKDDDGLTALLYSCEKKEYENIKLLLEFGSDINIMTEDNKTLIDLILLEHRDSNSSDDSNDADDSNDSHDSDYAEIYIPRYSNKFRMMRTIKLHIIKLKAANLYINENILDSIDTAVDDVLKAYPAKCAEEISMLRQEKIANNVSFYDILTKNINSLAKYARNEDLKMAFESNNYKFKFPIYANMIDQNFKTGFQRKILLDQSHDFFDCYFKLPYDCVDQINSYLSYDDLRAIDDLWNQLSTSSQNGPALN